MRPGLSTARLPPFADVPVGPPPDLAAAPVHPSFPVYHPPDAGFDEAVGPGGEPRPHWRRLFAGLADLGRDEFARRWKDARHLIRENGVTYNVYGDPRGMARPWQLDPLPLVIPAADADRLRAGLVQRARVLELIAADLYGPQRLLADGVVPAGLAFANPGFLRPCHGALPPGGRYLHLYAANLGRMADGTWAVLGDRTQAPSGAGYALENRLVLTRTLPEAFKDCRVHRLALFFRALQTALRDIAPRNKDNPRVVVLTPGPHNETYFEHAYLARYLGYTLAEGGDLTVRDDRVYLKVLGGLQPVDVLFRRLDDDFCDPLELRPDSFLGVPGLVNAVRAGTVAVANALGSGAVEAAGLLGYLPAVCRHVLGEDLLLPSVPTYWCGDPVLRDHVLAHLDRLVVKPAFPAARAEPAFADRLSAADRAALGDRIRARPWEYVGQEPAPLSTAPVLVGDRFEPRRLVTRAYLAADPAGGFVAMPGGLTRVSGAADGRVVSMRRGGGSKDTWVLSAGPVSTFTLLRHGPLPVELTRAGGDLPSRAADNLFWLGRYAERAEGTARLLRGIVGRLADRTEADDAPELPALVRALTAPDDADPRPADAPLDPRFEAVGWVFDLARPGTLASALDHLRQVAGLVRDRMSADMWRAISGLADFPARRYPPPGLPTLGDATDPRDEAPTLGDVSDVLNRTVLTLAAVGGLAADGMTRGEGWRFLDLGRRLERALHMVRLLRAALVAPAAHEGQVLDAVLEVADSGLTYRRRYLGSLRAEAVLDLLLCDETNPRAVAAQLAALSDDVDRLPRPGPGAGRGPDQRLALSALTAVQLAEPDRLAVARDGVRPGLRDLLAHLTATLPALSDALTQRYLIHLQTTRHLAPPDAPPDPTGGRDGL